MWASWKYRIPGPYITLGYPLAGVVNSSALAYFLVAYRHRSIGKACRELGLSQPALSKTIRRLEDELRVPLFQRTPVGIEPTSYGDMLARRAMIVQNEIGRAVSEIETLRSHMGGEARIGVGPALAASLVSQALASFLKARPQMVVHLQEGLYESLSDAVVTGRYDFAVTTRPSAPIAADLTATLLFKDRFVFAAGAQHPLARRKPEVGPNSTPSRATQASLPGPVPPAVPWGRKIGNGQTSRRR